jgi:CheY-like chemotaxis protein
MSSAHRILVIEDDSAFREVLCAALEYDGYHPLPCDHIPEPVNVQQLRASLVLLDLDLRGEPEGYGFLESLREWPWTRTLPVLVCSGHIVLTAPAAERVCALADGVLLKPLDLDLLLDAVRKVLGSGTGNAIDRMVLHEPAATPNVNVKRSAVFRSPI